MDGAHGHDTRDAHLVHFRALDREAQAGAIRRLAALGHSPATIAAATRLSVEAVRRILEEMDRDASRRDRAVTSL